MNNNTKQFFDIVKNGDLVGFHYKKWDYIIAKTIDFFAYRFNPMKEKLIRIEHIGMIFDVIKVNDTIKFSFGESLGSEHGKKVSRFAINKNDNDDEYLIDSKFLNKNIDYYIIPAKQELSKDENIYAREFWNKKEKYSVINAMTSPNWIQKIAKRFIKDKSLNNLDNFCSGEVNRFFFDIGRCDDCDLLPSPAEIINQSYIDKDKVFKL